MNPLAKQYFQANPAAKYWYFNTNIRVANPGLRPWQDDELEPWPPAHATLNQ